MLECNVTFVSLEILIAYLRPKYGPRSLAVHMTPVRTPHPRAAHFFKPRGCDAYNSACPQKCTSPLGVDVFVLETDIDAESQVYLLLKPFYSLNNLYGLTYICLKEPLRNLFLFL